MTKIVINADDTPEEIERKMKDGLSHIPLILKAWEKHFGASFKGRTSDSESGNEGSTPSVPATECDGYHYEYGGRRICQTWGSRCPDLK